MSTHFLGGIVVGALGFWAYTKYVRRPAKMA